MEKEKLAEGQGSWQKKSFRMKVADALWILLQSNEEKREKINEKNESLMKSFRDWLGRYYYEKWYIHDKFDFKKGREYIRFWDTIRFKTLKELKKFLADGYNFNYIARGYVTLKIDSSEDWNLDDLKFVLEYLDLWTYAVKIKFPSLFFTSEKAIKMLEKFILRQWNLDCYFDIWDRIHRGECEYWDKTDYLEELINRFTKKGKSWKINNCVIKANWKEYHSSWNYKYEFK